ncbi:unnamed protein product [Lota lota]
MARSPPPPRTEALIKRRADAAGGGGGRQAVSGRRATARRDSIKSFLLKPCGRKIPLLTSCYAGSWEYAKWRRCNCGPLKRRGFQWASDDETAPRPPASATYTPGSAACSPASWVT